MAKEYSREELLTMYTKLKQARMFSQKIEQAVYDGHIRGAYHQPEGQEATSIGITTAIKPTDWLGYTHRGSLLMLERYGPEDLIPEMFANKSGACGLPYQIVYDGTDVLAVREAMDKAVAEAREGKPNVVEIKNLRWGAHSIGHLNESYRNDMDKQKEAKAGSGDCVVRMEKHLMEKSLIDEAFIANVVAEYEKKLDDCITEALKSSPPTFEEIYKKEYIYATPQTGGDL